MTISPPTPEASAHPAKDFRLLLKGLLRTRQARDTLSILIPEVCALWAGDNRFKQKIAELLGKMLTDGITLENTETACIASSIGDIAEQMDAMLPFIAGAGVSACEAVLAGIESLPPRRRAELIRNTFLSVAGEPFGEMITRLIRLLNEIHPENPRILTESIIPVLRAWYEQTDFGELRDFLDGSEMEFAAFAKVLNDLLWQYPAKLVLLLSALPDLVNAIALVIKESIAGFNDVSPDLTADILLSLFRRLNGDTIGRCLAESMELIRKAHTGSALIGDPGKPRFIEDLSRLIRAVSRQMDGHILAKARVALAEDREAIQRVLCDELASHPDLWLAQIRSYGDLKNTEIRALRYRLTVLEGLPDDALAEAALNGISSLDIQEAAEIANLSARMFNRIHAVRPEVIKTVVSQFADSLDLNSIESMASQAISVLGPALRPIGRAVLPGVIRELCVWMQPADDLHETEMALAREQLRGLLNPGEATA